MSWFVFNNGFLIFQQAKRAEPSNVVDYEKIDEDARVSPTALFRVTSTT